MDLKTMFDKLAVTMINKTFGSVAQTVTIRHPLYSNYDEETGAIITAHEDYIVKGIVGPWINNNEEAQRSHIVDSQDVSVLIATSDLELINPAVNYDTVITQDGSEWALAFIQRDPANATFKFKLSKNITSDYE